MKGYVYVLTNQSMPGIVKIGRSKDGGRARAASLYTTGVPTQFDVAFEILSWDCVTAESRAHDELSKHRVNASREFFKIEVHDAVRVVASCALADWDLDAAHAELVDPLLAHWISDAAGVIAPVWRDVVKNVPQSEWEKAGSKWHEKEARRGRKLTLAKIGGE